MVFGGQRPNQCYVTISVPPSNPEGFPEAIYISFGFLLRRRDHNVSEIYRPVIALKQNRSRFAFLAVDRSARNSRNFLVAKDGFAIGYNRNHAPNQRNIIRLPFTRVFSCAISLGVRKPYTAPRYPFHGSFPLSSSI